MVQPTPKTFQDTYPGLRRAKPKRPSIRHIGVTRTAPVSRVVSASISF